MSDGQTDGTDDEVTTIKVSRETWRRLNRRKQRPDESFDDIVQELLTQAEEDDQGNPKTATAD